MDLELQENLCYTKSFSGIVQRKSVNNFYLS